MTAPDPGLTDLIAAHQVGERWTDFEYPSIFSDKPFMATTVRKMVNCSCGESMPADDHPAHVALVVEQHTNGRIASDLGADPQDYEIAWAAKRRWQARAEKAEATIARVEKLANDMRGWCSPHGISVTYSDRILAALEGES